jgi:ribosomal-protein-alanine N-acetyltransferase
VIETERLFIRSPDAEDHDVLFALWTNPANERLAFAKEPPSEAQVRRWLESAWGVWELGSGELVGDCSLSFDEGFQEWELSYGFRRDRWGRGYATEAGGACVRHGFEVLGVEKIVADVDPANTASAHVLEKLGFRHVGEVDGKLFYELTRETSR